MAKNGKNGVPVATTARKREASQGFIALMAGISLVAFVAVNHVAGYVIPVASSRGPAAALTSIPVALLDFARSPWALSLDPAAVAVGLAGPAAVVLVYLLGGKKADAVVTWLIDLMLGIPHIVLLILISFALGKGFWGVTIGVAVTHWPSLARVVRAEILQCKQSTFVAAARRLGQTPLRIAAKHMVPYVLPQFIVGLILLFPHAILHEAAVTFLGFGLPPEQPAIGVILSESMAYLSAGMWWLAVFPGLALIATVLLFDLAGSSLRKLVDPHSAQE